MDLQLDEKFLTDMSKCIKDTDEDIVFIHIKGPDEPGHDNKPMDKVMAIEVIDKFFIEPLVNSLNSDDIVIVTCDHATPCELKLHSNDKVPLLISGGNISVDSTIAFNEKEASSGMLKIKKGIDILPYILH